LANCRTFKIFFSSVDIATSLSSKLFIDVMMYLLKTRLIVKWKLILNSQHDAWRRTNITYTFNYLIFIITSLYHPSPSFHYFNMICAHLQWWSIICSLISNWMRARDIYQLVFLTLISSSISKFWKGGTNEKMFTLNCLRDKVD
jgi:hypothetical protein